MAVQVFLNFDGNCREAVEFYADIFGCEKPVFQTYGDIPKDVGYPPLPEEQQKLILYTDLKIADSTVMFSDCPPVYELIKSNNINLTVVAKDKTEAERWFNGLKEGGSVHMELQTTFFSPYYGMLVDKFGIPWQVMLSPAE